MPLLRRHTPAGRYGQRRLDPGAPLVVRRRISLGGGVAMLPGQPFVAGSVTPIRLQQLYRVGCIAHGDAAEPVAVQDVVAAALARAVPVVDLPAPPPPVAAPPVVTPPPAPAPPSRPLLGSRHRARS